MSRKGSLHPLPPWWIRCWGVGCSSVHGTHEVPVVHVAKSQMCHPHSEPTCWVRMLLNWFLSPSDSPCTGWQWWVRVESPWLCHLPAHKIVLELKVGRPQAKFYKFHQLWCWDAGFLSPGLVAGNRHIHTHSLIFFACHSPGGFLDAATLCLCYIFICMRVCVCACECARTRVCVRNLIKPKPGGTQCCHVPET